MRITGEMSIPPRSGITRRIGRNKAVRVAGDPQHLLEKVIPEIARLPGG